MMGRKLFFKHSLELLNTFRSTEFGVVSTIQGPML